MYRVCKSLLTLRACLCEWLACVSGVLRLVDERSVPFGTAEAEAVGKLALQGIPKLLLLILGELDQGVVELLELRILLLEGRVVAPAAVVASTAAASTAAAKAATSLAALFPPVAVSTSIGFWSSN